MAEHKQVVSNKKKSKVKPNLDLENNGNGAGASQSNELLGSQTKDESKNSIGNSALGNTHEMIAKELYGQFAPRLIFFLQHYSTRQPSETFCHETLRYFGAILTRKIKLFGFEKYRPLIVYQAFLDSLSKTKPILSTNELKQLNDEFLIYLHQVEKLDHDALSAVFNLSAGTIAVRLQHLTSRRPMRVEESNPGSNKESPEPIKIPDFQNYQFLIGALGQSQINWTHLPWWLKVSIEGILATALIATLVIWLPRLNSMYDWWIEHPMELNRIVSKQRTSESVSSSNPTSQNTAPTASDVATPEVANGQKTSASAEPHITSEFSEREGANASAQKSYRIMLRSDSPENIRQGLASLLVKMGATTGGGQLSGTDFPGGLLFDFYLPIKQYKPFMSAIATYGEMKVIITQSKGDISPGKTRVKIWVQRI